MSQKYIFGKKGSGSYITSDTSIEKSLRDYMKFVKKYKSIPAKEQVKLLIKYHDSNTSEIEKQKIYESIIYSNQRMIISIVKKEISINHNNDKSQIYLMDYIQEANIGLIKAFEKYNPSYKVLFYTYAAYWIRHHINVFMNSVVDENKIIPQSFKKKILKLISFINKKLDNNIIPGAEEIIKASKINKSEYSILQPYIVEIYSEYSINPNKKPELLEKYSILNSLKNNPSFVNYMLEHANKSKTKEYESNVYNYNKDKISWDKEKAIIDILKKAKINHKYIDAIKKIIRDEKVDPKIKYTALKEIKKNKVLSDIIRKILRS
ncbi:MAG: sigma factor [Candidatus Aenigmatarchaeota archaeon]